MKQATTVKRYLELIEELPQLIKSSGLKEMVFYQELGLSNKTWHNRKTLKNWKPEEVLRVLELIDKSPGINK